MKNRTLLLIISVLLLMSAPKSALSQNTSETNLGKVELSVKYLFTREIEKERVKLQLMDTTSLDISAAVSVYFDANKSVRDSIAKEKNKTIMQSLKSMQVIKDANTLEDRLSANREPSSVIDKGRNIESFLFKYRKEGKAITMDDGPSQSSFSSKRAYMKVTENIAPQDWQISTDTTSVLGYLCTKATTTFRGRDYVAWFTQEIPINEGPWKLHGLPGLILKAEDTAGLFRFEAIGITQPNDKVIPAPADGNITDASLKQYYAFRRNITKNITYTFFDNGKMDVFTAKNPNVYPEIELEFEE